MKLSKDIIWFIIILILSNFLTFTLSRRNVPIINENYFKERVESLKKENSFFTKSIAIRNKDIIKYKIKIDSLYIANDSLRKIKKTVIIEINKYENFKSPNYIASADTMQSIFTENNIK
jgi:hypothetical protein